MGGFQFRFVLMKSVKLRIKVVALTILSLFVFGFSAKTMAGDLVLVMPFENRSQQPEYNWIRESFVILMADLLDVPGVVIINADERNMAFERLRLNPADLLTRAAMIRVAETAQANLVLLGEYDIGGEKGNLSIAINARLVETQEGRLVGNKVFNFSGPLSDLQQMQGQFGAGHSGHRSLHGALTLAMGVARADTRATSSPATNQPPHLPPAQSRDRL